VLNTVRKKLLYVVWVYCCCGYVVSACSKTTTSTTATTASVVTTTIYDSPKHTAIRRDVNRLDGLGQYKSCGFEPQSLPRTHIQQTSGIVLFFCGWCLEISNNMGREVATHSTSWLQRTFPTNSWVVKMVQSAGPDYPKLELLPILKL